VDGVAGILESALYYPHAERGAVLRFYEETLGLRQVASWDNGCAYRLGPGVLLLFDLELLDGQGGPVSDHGAAPGGHVCLVADSGEYGAVRERLASAKVEITHDHDWPKGGRSFYFKDPAGNLLEVADSDLWPA
jgi:catechol 2,3-dioxygenase-like lactoylglutathione lyase family enzyme